MVPLIALLALDVTVRLRAIQGGGETISVPLEEYVTGVLAGEAASMPPEARKAMAVAARTYAVRFRGRHRTQGYDFCDTTHCQDYRRVAIHDAVRESARATRGELLWREGSLVEAYYTKSCTDPWRRVIPVRDLAGPIEPVRYREPGRALLLRYAGRLLDAAAARQAIGTERLPSSQFDVHRQGGDYVFEGVGQGHGEGLCQVEAARSGLAYEEILKRYYPGSVVGLSAAGIRWMVAHGEAVEVWSVSANSPWVTRADGALRQAERLAGWTIPQRPVIRVYPTVTMFRDATGQSGSVAGIWRDGEIHLQPSASPLALRHELLHAVLESRSAGRHPWWFREGLTLALNGDAPIDARYAEARKRVSALIARHGRDAVLGFWQRGLPSDSHPSRVR